MQHDAVENVACESGNPDEIVASRVVCLKQSWGNLPHFACSGRLTKPANLIAAIASMRQRIAQLEAEKTKLLNGMDETVGESPEKCLAAVNKDLATAHERLVHYEAQVGRQN